MAHNLKVVGSNPTPATKITKQNKRLPCGIKIPQSVLLFTSTPHQHRHRKTAFVRSHVHSRAFTGIEEGDPVTLTEARTTTFAHRRKVVMVPTPTIRGFLRRRQRRLQAMQRMAAILDTVPLAPFINGLRGNPEMFRKRRSGITAGLDRGTNLRRRCRLLVKINLHGGSPSQSFLRKDLALNSADRRGEMCSSGMEQLVMSYISAC